MSQTQTGAVAVEQRRLKHRRHIVTPEGVAIPVDLAGRGDRLGALLIDLLVIYGTIAVVAILALLAAASDLPASWAFTMITLLSFLLRSFYFIYFELRWQGRTPGKRALGIRVIDRRGKSLSAESVFARNLMREVEVFIPASVLLNLPFAGNDPTLFFVLLWLGVLLALPFFNRDRMRAGDMIAGTWVVKAPKQALLPDIADSTRAETAAWDRVPEGLRFSRTQLDVYGIYELQTLEEVLRQSGPHADQARRDVAARIQKKISWQPQRGQPVDSKAFLEAFYTALRGHLETRLLFGERREDKFHRDPTGQDGTRKGS